MSKLQCYHFNSEDDTVNLLFEFKDEPSYDKCSGLGYWDQSGENLGNIYLSPKVEATFKPSIHFVSKQVHKTELVSYDFLIALLDQSHNIIDRVQTIVTYFDKNSVIEVNQLMIELIDLILIKWDDL